MNEQPSTARIALKWGAILGIASIVFSTILYVTDSTDSGWLGLIAYGLIIGGIIAAMREFKFLNGGYMSFGEGVSVGTLTAAISGFLSSLFSVFYTTVIDTGVMTRVADRLREKLEDQGLSDSQIDQQMVFMEKFQHPGILFAGGVIGSVFLGLIFSLIIAAFIRHNKANPFD